MHSSRAMMGSRCCLLMAWLLAALPMALASGWASARGIHYGAVADPALDRCDALQWRGDRVAARDCYRQLLASAVPAPVRAEAAWALGDLKTANTLYQSAVAAAPDNATVRLRWGELFAQTYQYQDALKLFNEAGERDPDNAFVVVAAARVLAERFEAEAATRLEGLRDNKDAPAGARLAGWLLTARMA